MSATQQAALDAFATREEDGGGADPSDTADRLTSPYARRVIERIEAIANGEAPPQPQEDIPHYRHVNLVAQEGDR